MKSNGYKIEFLPLERRLQERRFIDSPPFFFGRERRLNERREIEPLEASKQVDPGPIPPQSLPH